jgi:hypothetical protein
MYHKKIITTLLATSLLWINLISATDFLSPQSAEEIYHSTYQFYTDNLDNLTPRVLGKIECELKKIINDQNTSQRILADSACLLFLLDCKTSYKKVMDILFNRADFNPRLYYDCIKEIRRLKAIKALELLP